MVELKVTTKGRITLRKQVLRHLGVKPGDRVELNLLPGGRAMIRAARRAETSEGFVGLLAGHTEKKATLAEIDAAIARGWADEK